MNRPINSARRDWGDLDDLFFRDDEIFVSQR